VSKNGNQIESLSAGAGWICHILIKSVDAVAPSYFNQVTLTQVCACVYKTSDYVG